MSSYSKWIDKEIKIARSGFSRAQTYSSYRALGDSDENFFGRQRKCRPDRRVEYQEYCFRNKEIWHNGLI